jgi:ketosteroid isomerase-like protein
VESDRDRLLRGYAEYNERGYEAILAMLDPEIVWSNPPNAMDHATWHGIAEVREWFDDAMTMFSELRFEPREVIECPDGERILVVATGYARGRTSGAVAEVPFAHLWTVSNGKATELRMFA